jgi:ferredoxin-NADP reductase
MTGLALWLQIAGGTGITPMLQVANEVLRNPDDKTEVSLIFGNVSEDDILLRKEIDKLAKQHKNFKVPLTTSLFYSICTSQTVLPSGGACLVFIMLGSVCCSLLPARISW